jgi:hypothetical protein
VFDGGFSGPRVRVPCPGIAGISTRGRRLARLRTDHPSCHRVPGRGKPLSLDIGRRLLSQPRSFLAGLVAFFRRMEEDRAIYAPARRVGLPIPVVHVGAGSRVMSAICRSCAGGLTQILVRCGAVIAGLGPAVDRPPVVHKGSSW